MLQKLVWSLVSSLCMLAPLSFPSSASDASDSPVPNSDFTQGGDLPLAWQLTGTGQWRDRQSLEVRGNGDDSSYWRCEGCSFQPQTLYRFRTRARRVGGSGSAITGPTFANRDQMGLTSEWKEMGHIFRTPENPGGYLRLGQWHATGGIQFDWCHISQVLPVHRRFGEVSLGEGEMIRGSQYQFLAGFSHEASNYHRPLHRVAAGFNSDRWTFGEGQYVIYRFELPGLQFLAGSVQFHVNYYARGKCVAEVSPDQQAWHTVGTASDVSTVDGQLPPSLLPAKVLYLRLRAEGPSNLQVNNIEFRAQLDGDMPASVGSTIFADLSRNTDLAALPSLWLRADPDLGGDTIQMLGVGDSMGDVAATFAPADGTPRGLTVKRQAAAQASIAIPPEGKNGDVLQLRFSGRGEVASTATLQLCVPDFYRSDYGERLTGVASDLGLWWCDATRKVPRQRALPAATGETLRMEAACDDWEAAQLVLRPSSEIRSLQIRPIELKGPGEARIPAENIRIYRVYYHFVHHPTDYTGVRDWWPDALPPLDEPLDIQPGENQPLWILVHVPRDAAPGDYEGQILLKSEDQSASVPIRLHVWNFALPERNHLETNYGLSAGNIFRYHGARSEEDKRKLLDLYFQSFAEHRISPYDPVPMDPIRVNFHTDRQPPSVEVDFSAFDPAMERALQRYRFTGYRLPVQGMGGGTFHQRWEPAIGSFTEHSPEYQALFTNYVGQLERHLREKGWLDVAYVYWFDEPAPRDYEFVAQGMERLDRYAPGLRRMLTEEPADNRLAGNVDIWCPVSHNYDHQVAEKRRRHGERFWWYVCTGPKAPYCTLFIDHPATELRIWHWQAWQRNIVGTLVWQSNYWTSSAAFPESAQNPYEDPMGYVSGYSTPRGTKRYWGNGDGRFIYPPLDAATPVAGGSDPVIAGPVSSIRWEMIREGVEDYEYLYLLRSLIDKHRDRIAAARLATYEALLQTPESITKDMTTFATDSTPIYRRRRQVAEAIEQLIQMP